MAISAASLASARMRKPERRQARIGEATTVPVVSPELCGRRRPTAPARGSRRWHPRSSTLARSLYRLSRLARSAALSRAVSSRKPSPALTTKNSNRILPCGVSSAAWRAGCDASRSMSLVMMPCSSFSASAPERAPRRGRQAARSGTTSCSRSRVDRQGRRHAEVCYTSRAQVSTALPPEASAHSADSSWNSQLRSHRQGRHRRQSRRHRRARHCGVRAAGSPRSATCRRSPAAR